MLLNEKDTSELITNWYKIWFDLMLGHLKATKAKRRWELRCATEAEQRVSTLLKSSLQISLARMSHIVRRGTPLSFLGYERDALKDFPPKTREKS
jgi:hypothetical protein